MLQKKFLSLLMFLFGAWIFQTMPAVAVDPSFDCARASSGIEQMICKNADLALEDKQMADAFNQRLGELTGTARQLLLDEQREWLNSLPAKCNPLSFQALQCLQYQFIGRTGTIKSSPYAIHLDCQADRAVVFLAPPDGGWQPSQNQISSADCVLRDTVNIRAAAARGGVKVWVNQRLIYPYRGINPDDVRIEITSATIELCGRNLASDRLAETEIRCVPLTNTSNVGPVDYLTFRPDKSAPRAGTTIVVFARDPKFCATFLRDGSLYMPSKYSPIAWDDDAAEPVPGETTGKMTGAIRFKIGIETFVFGRWPDGYRLSDVPWPYGSLVRQLGGIRGEEVCRFAAVEGPP